WMMLRWALMPTMPHMPLDAPYPGEAPVYWMPRARPRPGARPRTAAGQPRTLSHPFPINNLRLARLLHHQGQSKRSDPGRRPRGRRKGSDPGDGLTMEVVRGDQGYVGAGPRHGRTGAAGLEAAAAAGRGGGGRRGAAAVADGRLAGQRRRGVRRA